MDDNYKAVILEPTASNAGGACGNNPHYETPYQTTAPYYTDNHMQIPGSGSPYSPQQNQKKAKRQRQSGRAGVSVVAVVLLCFLSSVVGGGILMGGYFAFFADTDQTPYYENGGSTLNSGKENSGTPLSTETQTQTQTQTQINVENVTSPATAVAKKVLPSITGIRVTTQQSYTDWWYGTRTKEVTGEGSGIIYTADGYILTNYHVIEAILSSSGEVNPTAKVEVYLYEDAQTAVPAALVGYDISADLAVLKVDKSGLTPIEIGNSNEISVGDIAIALGNPGGLDFMGSVSQGIISGLNRTIQLENTYKNIKLIQTDAAINPGNSGGALTDINGKLIGVNSVKLVESGYEGMGFAIPVNDVVSICDDIIKNGNKNIYLGLEFDTQHSAEDLEQLHYPGGLIVSEVVSGGPADQAGFAVDDIIVSFNGMETRTVSDLGKAKNQCAPGDTVTVRVYRLNTWNAMTRRWSGDYLDLTITLG